jgi:hypothetical protein
MSHLPSLTKAQLGAMLGAFQFSAGTPLVVPGEDGAAAPLSEIADEFSASAVVPMRRMEGMPLTVQTRFGWAWVMREKQDDTMLATIRQKGGDELVVACRAFGGYAQAELACRTALFTIEQSAAVTLGRASRRSCEVKTRVDWIWPDLSTVKLGRSGGDVAAWKGIAEPPAYKPLPRQMIERIAAAIVIVMGEGWGRVVTKTRYCKPPVTHFSIERKATLDFARARNRAPLYPVAMTDFLEAAALMRPDIFPFKKG